MSGEIPGGYKRARRADSASLGQNPNVPQNYVYVERKEGWDIPFGSPESLEFWRYQQNLKVNAAIQLEMQKPESERFKPPEQYNPLSLDALSTGEYAFAAGMGRAAFGANYSAKEAFMRKEQFADVYTQVERGTVKQIETGELGYLDPYNKNAPRNQEAVTSGYAQSQATVNRLAGSLIYDPFSYLTGVKTGVTVFVNGKKVQLTKDGTTFLSGMLQSAKVKESHKVMYQFSKMLAQNPEMFAAFVQKDGLRIVWTNIELVPRQYLPWTWVAPTGKKVIDIGKNAWDTIGSAFTRKFAGLFSKTPKNAPLPPPSVFNTMRSATQQELVYARQAVQKRVDDLLNRAKSQMGGVNPKLIMTEYAENPAIRALHPQLEGIYKEWEQIRKQMAQIEKAEGVLHTERMDYIRHFLTYTAKKAKGIVSQKVNAPFDIKRKIDGRITEINYQSMTENGYKLFNDDFFFLMRKRMEEHEQVMATVKLIKSVGQQFGRSAKDVAKNSDYVQSSLPQLRGIWLPRSVEEALKNDANIKYVKDLMGVKTKYEVAKDVVVFPFKKAYDFQAWTLHTWEKLQTRGFPAFYAVNYYGGKFMALIGGSADIADDAAAISQMRRSTEPGKVIIKSELDPRITYTKEQLDELTRKYKLNRVDPLGVESGKYEQKIGITSKAGWMMEEELRTSMFFNRLRKGDTPDDAYAYVIKYQFDYTTELQGADKILSDWIPFYRWQRNAIPFFASMTFEAYGKMRAFGALAAGTWHSPQAEVIKPYMPTWAKSRVNIFMGGERNDILSVNLPISTVPDAINKLSSPGNATQFLGPVPQIAYQEYTGKETFTGKNITDPYMFPIKFMFNRHIQTFQKITNPNVPWWEKGLELGTGINVYQANDWLSYSGLLEDNSEKMVTNSIRRLNGRYHGCGY